MNTVERIEKLSRTLSLDGLERAIGLLLMNYGAKRSPSDPGLAIKLIAEATIETIADMFEAAGRARETGIVSVGPALPSNVAEELHRYMSFRAAAEQQNYDLSPSYFAPYLQQGVRVYFGVTVDETGIVSDAQAPSLLARYRQEHSH